MLEENTLSCDVHFRRIVNASMGTIIIDILTAVQKLLHVSATSEIRVPDIGFLTICGVLARLTNRNAIYAP